MAEFKKAYALTRTSLEGGYANVKNDKGGETYAGIARNIYPENNIWDYIDFIKRTKFVGGIPHNTHFPDIEYMVEQFYSDIWEAYHLNQIISQKVANLIFDYIVHSGKAVKNIQKVLGVTQDGIIGPNTLRAINSQNPTTLFNKILAERKEYLDGLIKKDPTQEVFREGWTNRLKFLATLNQSKIENWLLFLTGLLLLILTLTKIL